MSDVQDNVILRQRQMQQRQILAMMGIQQWIQPDSPTMSMASLLMAEAELAANIDSNHTTTDVDHHIAPQATRQQPVSTDLQDHKDFESELTLSQPSRISSPVMTVDTYDDNHSAEYINRYINGYSDDYKEAENATDEPTSKNDSINTLSEVSPLIEPLIEPLLETFSVHKATDNQPTIAPFDLQGGRYGNWVLLVDIQALTHASQKLWQNMTQALDITCETSAFPICAGMDTAELANASLAGYLFKVGRSENIQVAALTALPEGLTHPNIVSVPTLDEMLSDSHLKSKLWQQLCK